MNMGKTPAFADVLISGCGYLGRRAAALWQKRGCNVAALTRTRREELSKLGIEPIIGDVLDPNSLTQLPAARTLLYAVGLDRSTGRSMKEVYVDGLVNVMRFLSRVERIIYVSSTSVYGQTDGSWVDESSATEPLEESGRVVLEAEAKLRPDAIRLRFAGIYGPDRILRKQAILSGEPLGGDAEKWLNLIHVEDGAAAILAAEANAKAGQVFNITDDEPTTRRDFYSLLAERLHAPPARFDGSPSSRETHRRVKNRHAKEVLGWAPRYPNHRLGLAAAVAASTRDSSLRGTSPGKCLT
jgi:nucleoside-diphosphate-sugar epimerase